METPSDYAKCSLEELSDIQRHIDVEKHPRAYAALLQEIAKRERQQSESFIKHRANFWKWLFTSPDTPGPADNPLIWWEQRRIPYNFIIGPIGLISFIIFVFSIASTGTLGAGEDAVEPLAVLVAPIAINICYCAGWVVESVLRAIWPAKQHIFGPLLFKLGLGFSLLIVTFPALFWLGYWLLQLSGVTR